MSLPDVKNNTRHLSKDFSLSLPGSGLLLPPRSLQLLLPLPQPLYFTGTLPSLLLDLLLVVLLPAVVLLQDVLVTGDHGGQVAHGDVATDVVPGAAGQTLSDQTDVTFVRQTPLQHGVVQT